MDFVRVAFALIPDNPLFDAVISASQAITNEFYYNENIIDDKIFPPHLSLHICTIPRPAITSLSCTLETLAAAGLPDITPISVEPSSGGYVMLTAERTTALMNLHEAVLTAATHARNGMDADPHGSPYIRDSFTPHFSLAKVSHRDHAEATTIGRSIVGTTASAPSRTFDLCDIGEHSERWEVLASFPATTARPVDRSGQ